MVPASTTPTMTLEESTLPRESETSTTSVPLTEPATYAPVMSIFAPEALVRSDHL